MRLVVSAVSMVALSASMAFAQSADWTGGYAGVSMATNTGTEEYSNSGVTDYDLEGPAFGAIGGYMWANGNLVYGAEAAISLGGVYEVETDTGNSYKDEYEFDRFVDLKGRVGYATGDFLVYGTLGVSRARYRSGIGGKSDTSTDTNGLIFGLGADYQFGGSYFAGAEYLRRNYDFYDAGQDEDIDAKINTFTLRVGMKF